MKKLKIYHLIDNRNIGAGKHILYGTIEDVRTYAKNLWVNLGMEQTKGEEHGFDAEEDFYMFLDDDGNLTSYLQKEFNIVLILVYEVDIEGFNI